MKEILEKLSSYNIFNYLFPGVVYVLLLSKYTNYNIVQNDILLGAFLYYFIGLIISRIGSLFIEPFLKYIKFIVFTDYNKFVTVSKIDSMLTTLSEVNNMYRTITAMFIILLCSKLYEKVEIYFSFIHNWRYEILIFSLFILFLFSYKKQTNYITKRINANT